MEGQENNKEQQEIKIQVLSTDNIASRRSLIPSLFALVIVFFFFNFFTISCGGQKFGSVTGVNLVTGTEIKGPEMFPGQKSKGEKIPSSAWAIIAMGAAIVGLGAYLIKEKREALIGTGAGVFGGSSLLILQFTIKNAIEKKAVGSPINVDFDFAYYGAIIAFVIAGYISYLIFKNKKIITAITPLQVDTANTPITENTTQYQTNICSVPQTNCFDTGKWISANKKVLALLFVVSIILFGVYYLFLKHDPSKDGQSIAIAYCDCNKKLIEQQIVVLKNFIVRFDSYKFKSSNIAQNTIDSLLKPINETASKCIDKINADKITLKDRYIIDKEQLEKFEYALNAQQELCKNDKQIILDELNLQVKNKIFSILGLSDQINKILSDKYGSRYRVENDSNNDLCEGDLEYFIKPNRKNNEYFPYIVQGDFNGDNIMDYAALVKDANMDQRGQLAIIWGGIHDIILMDIGGEVISLFKGNEEVEEVTGEEGGKKVFVENNAIVVEHLEAFSYILYWDGTSFRSISTSI